MNEHKIAHKISGYMGDDDHLDLNWKVLFKDIFRHHTSDDAEKIFSWGTSETTPPVSTISTDWPCPWLYSRVFAVLMSAYIILDVCFRLFANTNVLPGVITLGSFAMPVATMVMFYELNAFRNLSFYKVFVLFLVGGCVSLLCTLILFDLIRFNPQELGFAEALVVGIIEETGKAIVVFFAMKKLCKPNNILYGLLVGAAIGAGFAAFESSGYAFNALMSRHVYQDAVGSIIIRGMLAPAGHVAWAAITGGALAFAARNDSLSFKTIISKKFRRIFIIPILLHFLWDSPLLLGLPMTRNLVLFFIVWLIVLILVDMGMDEVKMLTAECQEQVETASQNSK